MCLSIEALCGCSLRWSLPKVERSRTQQAPSFVQYMLLKLDGKIRSLRSQAPFCIDWSILHKSTVHVREMFVHFLWGVKILVSSEKNMILSPKFSFINLMFMPWISEVEADTGKIYIWDCSALNASDDVTVIVSLKICQFILFVRSFKFVKFHNLLLCLLKLA